MTSYQPIPSDISLNPDAIRGVRRYESLFGRLVPVLDASESTSERTASSAPDLRVFRLRDVFSEGSIFLGFGRPNVFLGLPRDGGGFDKFDAKSFKREPSKVINTRGWAQSGMLLHIQPEAGMLNRLREAANKHSGTRSWTCVNANCRVLDDAGFTSAGKTLRDFSMAMAEQIIRHGLEFQGKPIGFEVVKTTPVYLENFGLSVIKAQCLTLCRHSSRFVEKKLRTSRFRPQSLGERMPVVPSALKPRAARVKPQGLSDITACEHERGRKTDRVLSISEPTPLGAVLRVMWGAHALFQLKSMNVEIGHYLPNTLKEFSAKDLSWFSKLKQHVLFSRPVVRFLRSQIMRSNLVVENCPQQEIFDMMRTHSQDMSNKYNIVMTGESIGVVRINVKYPQIDWVLSKHVLTSGYSADVRFAGEMWKGKDGVVYINNDSGTYQPSPQDAQRAAEYLQAIFPTVRFRAVTQACDSY